MSIVASEFDLSPQRAARRGEIATRLLPLTLVVLATMVFAPSLGGLNPLWLGGVDSAYSHGPLLAVVCVYLLWRDGAGLNLRLARPSGYALAALALVMLLWVAARVAQVSSLEESLWPLGCWLVLAATLGVPIARRYLVALGLMYLALPIWSPLVDALLWPLSATMPTLLLKLIGTPVFLDGHFIHVPEGAFEVAAGCTGLHFFLAASVVAVLAAHLGRARWREWLLLVGSAAALSMIANWLRITAVVYAGHVTEMQHPWVTVDHRPLGWKIFAVMILCYCYAVRRWLPVREEPVSQSAGAATRDGSNRHHERATLVWALGTAALPLLLATAWVFAADRLERIPVVFPVIFPQEVSGLGARRDANSNDWQPVFIGAARVQTVEYGEGVHRLLGYQNAYARETQVAKLILFWNSVAGAGWHTAAEHPFKVTGATRPLVGSEMEAVDLLGRPWLLRSVYSVGGRFTASPIRVKFASAAGALGFDPPSRGLIATAVRCTTSCDAARRDADVFWMRIAGP